MPCYQSSNLPSGVTTTGRTGYKTEAECLQACKEGACCEGTTCSVKPQCQCQCTTGRCCGPDTSNYYGVIGPTCRGGTKAECDARGGVWTDCAGCTADAANPSLSICKQTDRIPQPPVFKGVGTTCDGNPCVTCECTQNTPDYIDVTFAAFDLTYRGSTNTITDMTGYQSQLQTFLETLSLRFYADVASSRKSSYIAYKYAGGCYQNNTVLFHPSIVFQGSPCETVPGCSDSATLLDTSSNGEGRLYCNGSFSFGMSLRTPIGCWDQFSNNKDGYTLYYALQGSGGAGSLNLCQGNIAPFSTHPASNNNPIFVSSYAAWSTGRYTSFYNYGTYLPSQSAEIRYTPHYANPLP